MRTCINNYAAAVNTYGHISVGLIKYEVLLYCSFFSSDFHYILYITLQFHNNYVE